MTSQPEPPPQEPASGGAGTSQKPFPVRTALQIAAGAFGLYLIGSGVYGLWKGGNPEPRPAAQQADAPAPGGACKADPKMLAALKAAAIGEVAGFSANAEPKKLGNFAFSAPDGTARRFSDFSGKVILVNLWATWCAPCRKEMPALDALQKARGGADFEVVTVNVDTRDTDRVGDFLDQIGIANLNRYADPTGGILQDMKKANRAPGLPSTVLLDRQGCELGFILGPAEWASKDALALVDAALGKAR